MPFDALDAPALFWDKIPEPELRAGRARAVALLEPLRAPDGSLRRGLGFCYTRFPRGTATGRDLVRAIRARETVAFQRRSD